jgi:RimJ/RimL family protein N-acetyltransferase
VSVPTLRLRAVVLRPWALADAQWYAVTATADPDIQAMTSEPPDLTAAAVAAAITHYAAVPTHLGWAITVDGALAGNAGLDLATGALAYWVAPEARGHGVATTAVRLMSAHAFAAGLAEVHLWVRAGNTASARVALRAGFSRTPARDHALTIKGEPWQAEYYALPRPPGAKSG